MKLVKFFTAVLLCSFVGTLGGITTASAIPEWYETLKKPAFTPPNAVFGPVWTVLYILMGISLYIIWAKKDDKKSAYTFFAIQLVLNFLWSFIFFKMKLPYLALLDIAFLWIAILVTIQKFKAISKSAGYLLVPYLLWVSFAGVLNFFIAALN